MDTFHKVNKKVMYILILVILIVFGLFFLNKQFDININAFSVRNDTITGGALMGESSEDSENTVEEQVENLKDYLYPDS